MCPNATQVAQIEPPPFLAAFSLAQRALPMILEESQDLFGRVLGPPVPHYHIRLFCHIEWPHYISLFLVEGDDFPYLWVLTILLCLGDCAILFLLDIGSFTGPFFGKNLSVTCALVWTLIIWSIYFWILLYHMHTRYQQPMVISKKIG